MGRSGGVGVRVRVRRGGWRERNMLFSTIFSVYDVMGLVRGFS
jgi:hypothetical protein